MPNRNPPSERQRQFLAYLARSRELVLSMRDRSEADAAAVNAHGKFALIDMTWPDSADDTNHDWESLLAMSRGGRIDMADTDEPVVHVHVDWSAIRFAWIGARPRTLIGTDKEVVFCREKDKASRVFWFNLRHWDDLAPAQWPKETWIDLEAPVSKGVGALRTEARASARCFHLALGVPDVDRTVADYERRVGCAPAVHIPGEYALWRTDALNLSVRRDAAFVLRHVGWEDPMAASFTCDTDLNGVAWEYFSAEHQAEEIARLWPESATLPE
jgi:hypothetical protein